MGRHHSPLPTLWKSDNRLRQRPMSLRGGRADAWQSLRLGARGRRYETLTRHLRMWTFGAQGEDDAAATNHRAGRVSSSQQRLTLFPGRTTEPQPLHHLLHGIPLPTVRTVHNVAQQAGSLRKPGAGRQRRAHPAFGGDSRARGRQCAGNTCNQPLQAYCCRRMPPVRRRDLGRRDSEVE